MLSFVFRHSLTLKSFPLTFLFTVTRPFTACPLNTRRPSPFFCSHPLVSSTLLPTYNHIFFHLNSSLYICPQRLITVISLLLSLPRLPMTILLLSYTPSHPLRNLPTLFPLDYELHEKLRSMSGGQPLLTSSMQTCPAYCTLPERRCGPTFTIIPSPAHPACNGLVQDVPHLQL